MSLAASIIEDAANETGLERVRIDRNEFLFVLTFGPITHRQTMQLDPEWDEGTLRAKLREAAGEPSMGSPAPPVSVIQQEPVRRRPGRPRKDAGPPQS
jgi:hypothetical protein